MEASCHAARLRLRELTRQEDALPVLLTGPRHVGKTTLLLELAAELGEAAIYASGDDPTLLLPHSWTRLWERAESRGRSGSDVTILLDEVQQWPKWRERVGAAVRQLAHNTARVRIVAAASAEDLQLDHRRHRPEFAHVRLAHWSASSVAETFDVDPIEAAEAVVAFGGYPGGYQFMADRARWSAFVREAIVEPALGRDVSALAPIRQPALLRQVFAAAALHPCETISLQRMQAVLLQAGALATIAGYLKLLEAAGLVAALSRYSSRTDRRRSAPPKLIVLNNALLSALSADGPPDRGGDRARHDTWIENACLAYAINAGQHVSYWREEPFDVDAVLEGDWGKWAVEVMPDAHSAVDYRGLHEFVARYPTFNPLVVTSHENLGVAERAGLAATTWQRFLLSGPPR